MFLTQGQVEAGYFTNNRYGTAGTTTQTTLASQGGLLINIDSATGDIARTTAGDLENNSALGIYARQDVAGWSVEADTAVTRTGTKTLKISTTSVAGAASCIIGADNREATYAGTKNRLYPLKASTKYKATCWAKTSGVASGAVFLTSWEWNSTYTGRVFNVSNTLTGTNDWTLLTLTFTTNAATVWGTISVANSVAGNVSDAWFDVNSMTLEEVVEPVANSLTSSSPSLVSFTAVGSTDNIDQSLDPTFAAVNTYTPPVAISEAAADRQTFVPTKSKCARIGVYPVAKGTGNWTVTIHDSSNVSQGAITIANASLTNGAVNYFNIPCNLTTGASYHFHVTSTVADGTVRVATAADLETCSYIQNYYKPTANFKASQNNSSVSVSSGNDEGFIEGSVMNLTTGAWSFTDSVNDGNINNNMYFERHVGTTFSGNTVQFAGANRYYILKINTGLPMVGDLTYTVNFITNNTFTYSYDNVSYNALGTLVATGGSFAIPMTGYSTVYIKNNANAIGSMTAHSASGTVNLSSLSTLRNYPTNKDIIKQYSTTLGSATTSATYRATKWGFPAIEYSSTEYQFLDVDTTATGSTVAFSELGTSYTTVADGASLAITSTSTPSIFVKANITANRLYVSSNDYNASSDKDGSNKQSVVYQVIQ